MVFVVKKVNKKTYLVRNKFSGASRGERSSYAEAQALATELNKQQRFVGAEFASVSHAGAGK